MDRASRTQNILISILCFVLGMILSYIIATSIAGRSVQDQSVQPPVTISQGPSDTGMEIAPDPASPDQNIATIPTLGVSFKYLKYGWSFDEDTHGVDRSILVPAPTIEGATILFGQDFSLRVYSKDPGQSLETAITSNFLTASSGTCFPVRVVANSDDQYYPLDSGIAYVRLHASVSNGCPPQFDMTSSTSVFFSLSSNPNTFFYVQGTPTPQLPLVTADGKPFWETLTFSTNN